MRLIDSMPPASTMSDSPSAIARAPAATASMPDAHALFTVVAGTRSGSPARRPTCRAGFGPEPACRAWPTNTSSMASPVIAARSSAARAAIAPSSAGCTSRKAPPYRPIGVRAALTMKTGAGSIRRLYVESRDFEECHAESEPRTSETTDSTDDTDWRTHNSSETAPSGQAGGEAADACPVPIEGPAAESLKSQNPGVFEIAKSA